MASVFVSYRRKDTPGHAGRLYDYLKRELGAHHVFRDNEGIGGGDDFGQVLTAKLLKCDVVLVIIGPRWLAMEDIKVSGRRIDHPEDWIRREVLTGLQSGKVVIPVLVDGAHMPTSEELPDDIAKLSGRHAVELSDKRWDYDCSMLLESIRRALPKQEESFGGGDSELATKASGTLASSPPPSAPRPSKLPWLVISALALIAVWGVSSSDPEAMSGCGTLIIGLSAVGVASAILADRFITRRLAFGYNAPTGLALRAGGGVGLVILFLGVGVSQCPTCYEASCEERQPRLYGTLRVPDEDPTHAGKLVIEGEGSEPCAPQVDASKFSFDTCLPTRVSVRYNDVRCASLGAGASYSGADLLFDQDNDLVLSVSDDGRMCDVRHLRGGYGGQVEFPKFEVEGWRVAVATCNVEQTDAYGRFVLPASCHPSEPEPVAHVSNPALGLDCGEFPLKKDQWNRLAECKSKSEGDGSGGAGGNGGGGGDGGDGGDRGGGLAESTGSERVGAVH